LEIYALWRGTSMTNPLVRREQICHDRSRRRMSAAGALGEGLFAALRHRPVALG